MKLYLFLFFLAVGFAACKASSQAETANETSSNEAVSQPKVIIYRVDNQTFANKIATSPDVQIVDVRTPGECTKGVIENSININYNDRDFLEQVVGKLDKSKPVMLYCAGGGRSAKAAKILEKQGFEEIYDLESGYSKWK